MSKTQINPLLNNLDKLTEAASIIIKDLIKQKALDKSIVKELVEKKLINAELSDLLHQGLEDKNLSAVVSKSEVDQVEQKLNDKSVMQKGGQGL